MPEPSTPTKIVTSFIGAVLLSLTPAPATAAPEISEFMAANSSTLADGDGAFSDWIEIHNPDTTVVSLTGYHLTDDALNPTKWTFPAVTLNPGARLIVFASNKNRTDPSGELHTNFRLSAGGEFLALFEPGGTTAASAFSPAYPPQFIDESFGFGEPGGGGQIDITPGWNFPDNYANIWISGNQAASEDAASDNLDAGTGAAFSQFYMWFDFTNRLAAIAPGSAVDSATLRWSGTVKPTIFGATTVASELGVFPVPDANKGIDSVAADFTGSGSDIAGFYAANTAVDSYTAVPGQTPVTTWDITSLVRDWIDNPGAPQRGQLMILNATRPMHMEWDVDGTDKPELTATVATTADPNAEPAWVYFDTPTPGNPNTGGQLSGPVFGEVTENPPQPVSEPLTITAAMAGSVNPVVSVSLFHRRAFNPETQLAMVDDGTGADAVAGDHVWTAVIPAAGIAPGEMTRWRFSARDNLGVETREPAFREPLDSHQYFGTVGHDPAIETNLQVVHWFLQSPNSANNTTGTRGALYYLGEFYDNIHFNRHGQSTGGFVKKSYNIDFNKTQRFQWSPDAPRAADIDLLTNWADKSKVRHPLAYEIMRESGVRTHFAFTVRVEQNGRFFSTADFVEDGDDVWLERAGLNKDGALYKVYSNRLNKDQGNTANSGVEKKNRKFEDNSDLQALIDGLDLTGSSLTNYMRDNIDIPKCVNMLAANSVIRNIDMHSKNWYIYRDTGKTNEWAILPWDLDLSGGRVWNTQNTYFDNALYTQGFVVTGTSIRLVSHLFNNPETRSMILRRIRTLSDRFLQPPDTPLAERWYERRLDEQSALIDPPGITPSDARRDFEKWGSWLQRGTVVPYTNSDPAVETMAEAILRWKNEYLPGRRDEIYNRQTVGNGGQIPAPQTDAVSVIQTPLVRAGAASFALVPSDDSLGFTWTSGPSFDTSGWIAGTTGVGYERGSGYESLIGTNVDTQMQSNNTVYIRVPFDVADPTAFESLELRMQWDDGFVAFLNGALLTAVNAPASLSWNSAATSASHEANAGGFDAYNISNKLSSLVAGRNILAIQGLNGSTGSSDMIIVPELHGGVTATGEPGQPELQFGAIEFSPPSGNQDEEYFELLNPFNFAVDISDWRITGGVEFTFQPGTVIPPGGTLHVSPDVNAFRARAQSPKGGEGLFVQGGYSGHLSSFGETLTLLDATGAELASTSYVGDPSDTQLNLVVSEIMYHPAGDGLAEFIELTNISDSLTLDLAGVRFIAGIDFDFTGSGVTSLGPGERVLVVRDAAAFAAAHGSGFPIAGVFANTSRLNNDGETIKLEDAANGTIKEFTYNDRAPWPEAADGTGYSMVLINPFSNPDPGIASNWRSSAMPGGNPDRTDTIPFPSNPLDDIDGNGVADIIDHALGNSLGNGPVPPTLGFADYLVGGQTRTLPTLHYPLSLGAQGVAVGVDTSVDMTTWQDAADSAEMVAIDNLGDGRARVTLRINEPAALEHRLFVRLRVRAQ